jgi:5-formyltetrahydrofolate cyclo-ligase
MISHKEVVRNELKVARKQMSAASRDQLSERIIARVIQQVDWSIVRTIHLYRPLTGYREVDTALLISYLQHSHKGIRIASWRKSDRDHHAVWLDLDQKVADGQQYDLIIVPLLGFNSSLHRIGFGGGFYDRFLKTQPHAQTIGLCYEANMVQFTAEKHDVALHCITTEERIITASQ